MGMINRMGRSVVRVAAVAHYKASETRQQRRSSLIMALSLIIAGCAFTNTKTNKDPQYTGHPSRLFVITNMFALGNSFSDEFERLLIQRVTSCSGEAQFSRLNPAEIVGPLSLQPQTGASTFAQERQQQIRAFRPDAIITIRLATVLMSGGQQEGDLTTDVYDVSLKRVVWKGVSSVGSGVFVAGSTKAQSFFNDIAEKLTRDGILPACAKTSTTK
jgi:hypothetical protein